MKFFLVTFLGSFILSNSTWQTDFDAAKQSAKSEHKLILLNFSGSDWCGPCIRMHKEIFESDAFVQYADGNHILVNADFPRLKKHELSKDQQKKNDRLADSYNKDGIFPRTLVLTSEGKVLKEWSGYPQISSDEFTRQVKAIVDANK